MSTASPTTTSPTTPDSFDAGYYGILGVVILSTIILVLLCCGCVAHAQNNFNASLAQNKLLKARLKQFEENQGTTTVEELGELLSQIEKSNQGGLLSDFADSFVVPASQNDVSDQIGLFFYHSSLGRFLLLGVEGALQYVNIILSIIFSGLVVTYINTHIVPTFANAAHGLFSIIMFLGILLIVVGMLSKQFSIFLLPRLGGTGMVEHLKSN